MEMSNIEKHVQTAIAMDDSTQNITVFDMDDLTHNGKSTFFYKKKINEGSRLENVGFGPESALPPRTI